ncbi:MAG: hypothetical protein VYA55_10175 [Pseudomonadota bacterium]|nr:hypothetical protein [Pseudomonadota bacterium]
MIRIKFKKGYKYQLEEACLIHTPILPSQPIDTYYIQLQTNGDLVLAKGYAWDGASGAPDVPSFMRASLVHDALYQLMRNDYLDREIHRKPADRLMRRMCLQDGMNPLLAAVAYGFVRALGEPHTRGLSRKELLFAP